MVLSGPIRVNQMVSYINWTEAFASISRPFLARDTHCLRHWKSRINSCTEWVCYTGEISFTSQIDYTLKSTIDSNNFLDWERLWSCFEKAVACQHCCQDNGSFILVWCFLQAKVILKWSRYRKCRSKEESLCVEKKSLRGGTFEVTGRSTNLMCAMFPWTFVFSFSPFSFLLKFFFGEEFWSNSALVKHVHS